MNVNLLLLLLKLEINVVYDKEIAKQYSQLIDEGPKTLDHALGRGKHLTY